MASDFVVPGGHDVHLGRFTRLAQRPLHIVRHRQLARPGGIVSEDQPLQLDRLAALVIHGNEDRQLLLDAMAVVLEDRVPRPVPGPVGGLLADRRCGRRPVDSGFLIPDVERFRRRIHHRIVRPLRQAVALAVALPGESGPGFADERAEGRGWR